MSYDTPTLSDTQTLKRARSILQEHLPLEAQGYSCQSEHLYDVLLGASAHQESIEALCQRMPSMPSADTLRRHLHGQLTIENLPEIEQGINEALRADLPKRLQRPQARPAHRHRLPRPPLLWPRRRGALGTRQRRHDAFPARGDASSTGGCAWRCVSCAQKTPPSAW